ncbi:hypothetical protein QWZ16_12770 [Vibrio ostreicida]|uniref:Uncharacterized protein n=1 Tax=Vibrio ostreicida TaxID=526588 RepID=A0ABT8BTT2_9VIBR|nr:hypothetical protein [Vibrio ostreicida]MDN3610577.1 hypothetical protein [Vibrio ostreicida]
MFAPFSNINNSPQFIAKMILDSNRRSLESNGSIKRGQRGALLVMSNDGIQRSEMVVIGLCGLMHTVGD